METIEIEGLITDEFDDEGFVKMFFTNSDSGKHIWLKAGIGEGGSPVVNRTEPGINPLYPQLEQLSLITINKAGFFKRSAELKAEPISTFIRDF